VIDIKPGDAKTSFGRSASRSNCAITKLWGRTEKAWFMSGHLVIKRAGAER